ncbi:GNAT family N-acetyltransferase [Schaalia sp. ZJ1691]|uniref:GNAT family N-acetyltransferase n=1 Tax=Schaalia sp. ZJ1691 TaxID=2709404 RepID=UPI0013EDD796|nr:GNAT family N-acetyltransferase [Schaalia sp. ZJ1691]
MTDREQSRGDDSHSRGHEGQPKPGADRSVRPAVKGDAHAIACIQFAELAEVFRATRGRAPGDAQRNALIDAWGAALEVPTPPGVRLLVALHGHGIAGFAFAVPAPPVEVDGERLDAGTEIAELSVDADFRRSGHGSRLLHALADTSHTPNLRVWIGVDDEARQRFYRSSGFAPAGLRRVLELADENPAGHASDSAETTGSADAQAQRKDNESANPPEPKTLTQHLWWAQNPKFSGNPSV